MIISMNRGRRGSVALVIVLIVVVILVAAAGVWYWKAYKSGTNNSQSQSVTPVQTTSTYQNTDYGISFDYPNNLTVKPGDTAEGDYGLYTPYGPYQNASSTVSLITVEILPSLYPGTNLKGAYFNLSVDKQLNQGQCLALTAQPGPNNGGGKTTIGGVTFNWTRAATAAAGTDEFSENYSGYTNDTCYEFNLGDTTGNDVSPTGTKMLGSANDISVLEGVLSSVKFTGSTSAVTNTSTTILIAKPTPTSSSQLPQVSFSVSPSIIVAGEGATLTWSSTNTASCGFTGTNAAYSNARWSDEGLSSSGSKVIIPYYGSPSAYTAQYQMVCTGPSGTSAPVPAGLTVLSTPADSQPYIDPTSLILIGGPDQSKLDVAVVGTGFASSSVVQISGQGFSKEVSPELVELWQGATEKMDFAIPSNIVNSTSTYTIQIIYNGFPSNPVDLIPNPPARG